VQTSVPMRAVRRPPFFSRFSFLVSKTSGRVGLFLTGAMLLVVILGPALAPYSPYAIGVGEPASGPSAAHLLGTDLLGRDIFSRFLNGGQQIVLIPLVAVAISAVLATGLGMWSGLKGGFVDGLTTRAIDLVFSLPPLLLAILVVAAFGSSSVVLVGVVVLWFVPRILRVVRGATHGIVGQDYILAALARGESTRAILIREVLPNITGHVIAESTTRLSLAIILISTFNFLGIGVQPPTPDWGLMASENRALIGVYPIACLAPAAAIAVMAIGVSLLADQVSRHLARNSSTDGRL
jgi:peptide/nickel transport system permease protein